MYTRYVLPLRVLPSVILLSFTVTVLNEASASPIFLKFNCSDATFLRNSSYGVNLGTLFSSLAMTTTGLYSDITVNSGAQSHNEVYGQFLCQGDYSIDECKSCVAYATNHLTRTCPASISAFIWYQGCTFSYSNVSIRLLGVYNLSSNLEWFEDSNQTVITSNDMTATTTFVATTLRKLTEQVVKVDNDVDRIQLSFLGAKYFGTKEVNLTRSSQVTSTVLYEMVQCAPDLSADECSVCLTLAINKLNNCGKGMLGGRVVSRSCFIRYETYRFYKLTEDLDLSPSSLLTDATSCPKGSITIKAVIAITIPVSIVLALSIIGVGLCVKKATIFQKDDGDFDGIESLQYNLSDLKAATNNFSNENKIGQGGFGSVYKGILESGQPIAVKKLFVSTSQMDEEFRNEVEVVAKLQHRNLVRLLGYCLAQDAKLLVFEYVPNKSLDKVLFATGDQVQLEWLTRFRIIVGIARGLLYLHEESRLRIVHRDLKPANILLDEDLNPKIADFGMARIFGIKHSDVAATYRNTAHSSAMDPTHQSTRRGGGTPGYMAPECAERRHFSVKTDVYSFGVLILEIVCGKRNSRFYQTGLADDLLCYCWMKWEVGTAMELIDDILRSNTTSLDEESRKQVPKSECLQSWMEWEEGTSQTTMESMDGPLESSTTSSDEELSKQVLTCIHLGLLCVQKDAKTRPTMDTIVHKLNYPSDNSLPVPLQPSVRFSASSLSLSSSLNGCSFSDLDDPR